MKNIVVYKITIALGFLILAYGLSAQKPAIDLISSNQQYRHPEAIVDTGYAMPPTFKDGFLTPTSAMQNQNLKEETVKKKRRQIGPSLDSLFQKKDREDIEKEKTPVKVNLFSRKYNPIKFLIYIIALK